MSAAAGHMRANAELSKRQDEMVQMCINFLGDPLYVDQVRTWLQSGIEGAQEQECIYACH